MSKSVSFQPAVSIRLSSHWDLQAESDTWPLGWSVLCVNFDSALISTYQTIVIYKYLCKLKTKSYELAKHKVTVKNAKYEIMPMAKLFSFS